LRASYGLDDPLPIQYFKWIGNALRGNFGFSFATGQAVTDILAQRLPATLELFVSAFALALVLTLVLGIFSAVNQGRMTDYIITILAYFGISLPIFLLGLFLQDIFGVALG